MLECTKAGDARLSLLVLHDDAESMAGQRRLPDTKVGTFTQTLFDEAKNGWTVISMKKDWKVIFPFENN